MSGGEITGIIAGIVAIIGHGAVLYYKLGKLEEKIEHTRQTSHNLAEHLRLRCPLCISSMPNPGNPGHKGG